MRVTSRSGSTRNRRCGIKALERQGADKIGICEFVAPGVYVFHVVVSQRDVFQRGVIDDFVARYASARLRTLCPVQPGV